MLNICYVHVKTEMAKPFSKKKIIAVKKSALLFFFP